MIKDEINPANWKSGEDAEYDWVKDARLTEIRVEELFGYRARRPIWNRENYPGQELNEVIRSNFEAVEAHDRKYDEQNN